jgi:hypothetical protein
MFSKFIAKSLSVYEIIWKKKNIVIRTGHVTIRRMRTACWIPTAANVHSEYVIIIAFPLQQWSSERASLFRYEYTVHHVEKSHQVPFKHYLFVS